MQQKRERKTLFYLWLLSEKENPNIGLLRSKFSEYWENNEDFIEPWFKKEIFNTKEAQDLEMVYYNIKQSELPDNVACGITYTTGMNC